MIQAKLNKIDLDRAKRALLAAGYRILTDDEKYLDFIHEGTRKRGTVYADGRIFSDRANVFQQIYAAQTIKDAAKRFGWKVKGNTATGSLVKINLGR